MYLNDEKSLTIVLTVYYFCKIYFFNIKVDNSFPLIYIYMNGVKSEVEDRSERMKILTG